MPGFVTHYIFGNIAYKEMIDDKVKESIRKYRKEFNLGLQGPDLFFYYPASFMINRKNLGSQMHTESTGTYLRFMIEYIAKERNIERKSILTAYVSGFMAHYILDCTCHPYIYWKSGYTNQDKDYFARHVELETDIDFLLCKNYLKKNLVEFNYGETVKIDNNSKKVIAGLLSYICNKTYNKIKFRKNTADSVITAFCYEIDLLRDKKKIKRKVVNTCEKLLIKHEKFSPMFIYDNYKVVNNDPLNNNKLEWENVWDENTVRSASFSELINEAKREYLSVIEKQSGYLFGGDSIDVMLKYIGNKSMHSGLQI